MTARTTLTYIDNSGERSSFSVNTPDLDATNIADYTDPTLGGALGDLRLATAAITLCNEVSQTVQAAQFLEAPTLPGSNFAQRESKLLIQYVDTVEPSVRGSLEIPGPDWSLVGQTGTDEVDFVGNVLVAAFVAALEANYVSRIGNPIEVVKATRVGRNN